MDAVGPAARRLSLRRAARFGALARHWQFDLLHDEVCAAEWDRRDVEEVWRRYTEAIEELAATRTCDVLAHPDFVKLAGRRPSAATLDECHDRMAEAAASSGMAAEISSAGWRYPGRRAVPGGGAARALRRSTRARHDRLGLPRARTASVNTPASSVGFAQAAGYRTLRAFRARVGHDVPLVLSPELDGRGIRR